jgi:hypothetical protein
MLLRTCMRALALRFAAAIGPDSPRVLLLDRLRAFCLSAAQDLSSAVI